MTTFCVVSTGIYTERVMPKSIGPVVTVVAKRATVEECEKHLDRLIKHNPSMWLRREIMPLAKVPKDAIGR